VQLELVGSDTGEFANQNAGSANISAQQRKDMEVYKKKIQVFEKKLADEIKQNDLCMK